MRVPLICTTCLHRIGMRNDCSATADDVPGCWESDGTDSGTQRLRGDVTPREAFEMARILKPVVKCPRLVFETCLPQGEVELDTSVVGLYAGLYTDEEPPQMTRVEWDVGLVRVPVGCRR